MGIKFNIENALKGITASGMPFIFKGMINTFLEEAK